MNYYLIKIVLIVYWFFSNNNFFQHCLSVKACSESFWEEATNLMLSYEDYLHYFSVGVCFVLFAIYSL